MALEPWEHLREEPIARYKVFDVHKARRRSPRTGKEIGFFLIRTPDWVNVVAFTRQDELVLVRQYRHGSREFTLEIPGGLIDAGEAPAHAAARELREETGYTAAALAPLGAVNPNPALFTNRCHTFLATGCALAGPPQQDDGEDMEVQLVPIAEAERMVRGGTIDHALVVAGLYLWRLQRGG
jgi:8-oxo-dGTP pyrophosphatase MutT (NUDIX family)